MNVVCACWVFADEKAGEYGCLQRVHVLLQYMEHLERLLYNAYEGCAVAMAAPPKVHTSFPFKLFDECGIVHCLSDHSFVLKEDCAVAKAAAHKVNLDLLWSLYFVCLCHSVLSSRKAMFWPWLHPLRNTSFCFKLFVQCCFVCLVFSLRKRHYGLGCSSNL